MLLKEKNIVITGSGRGIGKSIAIACAKEGANVGLTSRTMEELNDTKIQIENLGLNIKISVKPADISNYEQVEKIFKDFHNELGLLNGVIANAGYSRMSNTHEFYPEKFSEIIDVNILGVFNTFKATYPYLKKDDKNAKAKFIITGSAAYTNPMPKFAAYTASKFATVGLQKSLAAEYKKENITFNQVLPTMVDTKLLRGSKAGDGNAPPGVMDPSDLTVYYLFLLSDDANRINDELIITSDFQEIQKLIGEAPSEKKENADIFMEYLEEKSPKIYTNVRKLKKLVQYLMEKAP
ncbi:MAG: SDR family oxidoreductase [Promethearchaeota archaeon]|nr:MAG: SDR family oxidoreductase [Candidatus Lokiarchaeota archaeon]